MGVVLFAAHPVFQPADSSPSGMFHGMPLRTLLGEGDSQIVASMFSNLQPNQVFLAGAREFDPDEERYIQAHQVSVFSPDTLAQNPQHVVDAIANGGFNNVYIHLDFDVLDPAQFPFTDFPAANGVDMPELITVLDMLRDHFKIVGFSLLELVAGENPSLAPLQPLFDWYTSHAQQ
jgi:arginase